MRSHAAWDDERPGNHYGHGEFLLDRNQPGRVNWICKFGSTHSKYLIWVHVFEIQSSRRLYSPVPLSFAPIIDYKLCSVGCPVPWSVPENPNKLCEKHHPKSQGPFVFYIGIPFSQNILQGTNISHLGKGKIIFKGALAGDMLVPKIPLVSYFIKSTISRGTPMNDEYDIEI